MPSIQLYYNDNGSPQPLPMGMSNAINVQTVTVLSESETPQSYTLDAFGSLQVFYNGVLAIEGQTYTVSNYTVTLADVAPVGTEIVFVRYTALSIGAVPIASRQTVGSVRIGNGISIDSTGLISMDSALPVQEGQAGKFLTTNGTIPSWATIDALPAQSGQSGKFLTTDGTNASWENIDLSSCLPISGGNITGDLTVQSKTVERVNAYGTGYIRYESGIQICWGNSNYFDITTSTQDWAANFPVAFNSIPKFSVCWLGGWAPWAHVGAEGLGTTGLSGFAYHDSTHSGYTACVVYTAFGTWK